MINGLRLFWEEKKRELTSVLEGFKTYPQAHAWLRHYLEVNSLPPKGHSFELL